MVSEKSIKFPGTLGYVKTKFHRSLPDGKPGCVTISQNTDGRYFASILFEVSKQTLEPANDAIGVDLGLKDFAITSNGVKHNQHKKAQKKLQKLERNKKRKQRKLALKNGYTNRRKAKLLVAKVCSKIARIRADYLARAIPQDSQRKPSNCDRKSLSQEPGQESQLSQSYF